tara:strand:- start:1057 stop:2499 length:1443 start_codon:yes stop_codon:yes gene_type:complete
MNILKKFFFISIFFFTLLIDSFAYEEKFILGVYRDIDSWVTRIPSKVHVNYIKKDGPAYDAGMNINDQIISVNNKKIENSLNVYNFVRYAKTKYIEIEVLRNGKKIKLNVLPKLENPGDYNMPLNFKVNLLGYDFSSPCKDTLNLKFENLRLYNECKLDSISRELEYLNLIEKDSKMYLRYIPEKILIMSYLGDFYIDLEKYSEGISLKKNAYQLSLKYDDYIQKENKDDYYFYNARKEKFALSLAKTYLYGKGVRDYKKAFELLKLAKIENPEAYLELGLMHLEGRGVDYNEKRAFNYIKKFNQKKIGLEQSYLGDFYLLGLGGSQKNYSKALRHYKLAELGSRGTVNYLNIKSLFQNNRLPIDAKEFYKWLEMNVNVETFSISVTMRLAYFSNTILKNYNEAYKWYYVCSKTPYDRSKIKLGQKNIELSVIKEKCIERLDILEKEYLTSKSIIQAKKEAENEILNKYIKNYKFKNSSL